MYFDPILRPTLVARIGGEGGGHKYVGLRQTAYLSQFMWAGDVRGWGWGCLTAGGAPNCDPAYTKHLYLVYAGWANSPRREIRGGGGEGGGEEPMGRD